MRKLLLSLLVILLGVSALKAGPVDVRTAQTIGMNFAAQTFSSASRSNDFDLVLATTQYFVFNVGDHGFVIVSADDTFRPIVGYSDEGTFDAENPSPEMMYYLDNLSKGRQCALQAKATADAQTVEEWASLRNAQEMPARNGRGGGFYLVSTRWDQNAPYNKYAPNNSYAGCVATAMSQVMAYWKYPTHGYGSHSYYHQQYGELSANFDTIYHYDLMPNAISIMSPEENIDAIAYFMYHCGVAVDMMYSPSGSGAYSEDVPDVVLKYFGYTNRCRIYYRDDYDLVGFQNLLKDQFDLGWPCYYSGSDLESNSGHAFVCDGYDQNDMFHFNWGWSGSGNGFYAIDELNVSGYGFNSGQAVVANYVPAEVFDHTAKAPASLQAVPSGNDDFSVTLSWINPSQTIDGHTIEVIDAIMIMRDGEAVEILENPNPGEAMSFIDPVGLPIQVDYTVHAVCQGNGGRKAHADGVKLGPTCDWTLSLATTDGEGMADGSLTLLNSSNVAVGSYGEEPLTDFPIELPLGRLSLVWEAPSTETTVEIKLMDSESNVVFYYLGLSSEMPSGIFFEVVNTCGGEPRYDKPSQLKAEVQGDDVLLQWTGINDPGYGYNIYRDGLYLNMTEDNTFLDVFAADQPHSYYVTAFCVEGETEPSNTCCVAIETEGMIPTQLDVEIRPNGRAKLSWDAPENTEGLSGYRVYRRTQDTDFKMVKAMPLHITDYTDSGLALDGNRYYYMVTSVYDEGAFESSPAHWLRKPELLYVEVNRTIIPSGLTLERQDDHLLLQWDPAYGADHYKVYCNGLVVADELTETQLQDSIRGEALTYWVTGVYNLVESSPSNKALYGNVAVDEVNETVTLYPNPTQGTVVLNAMGLQEVLVYNATGQLVQRHQVSGSEIHIDMSGLSSGVYLLQIRTVHEKCLRKVVLMGN